MVPRLWFGRWFGRNGAVFTASVVPIAQGDNLSVIVIYIG